MSKKITHKIKYLGDAHTICGKDTVDVANFGDSLTFENRKVSCVRCLTKIFPKFNLFGRLEG